MYPINMLADIIAKAKGDASPSDLALDKPVPCLKKMQCT